MNNSDELTYREIEVASLSTFGLKIPEIAKILIVSEHTIKNHFNSIRLKFKVHNRVQVAVKFVRRNYDILPSPNFSKEYNNVILKLIKSPPKREPEKWWLEE